MPAGVAPVVIERDLEMTARDGVVLRANVHRPDRPGRFPVLLLRTPYGKDLAMVDAEREREFFPRHGYVVVVQDTRGRHRSDGTFTPFADEALDGFDAVEWAARLPWSDGRVATLGQSYCGSVQYLLAPTRPPHLVAASPVSGPVSLFHACVYRNGSFELAWMLAYFAFMARDTLERDGRTEELAALDRFLRRPELPMSGFTTRWLRHLPLREWGDLLAPGAPYFRELLDHSTDGPYWWATDVRRRVRDVNVPMLHVSSWYDAFQFDALELFASLRREAMSEDARLGQRLIMGPWAHQMSFATPTSGGTGDVDFGPEASIDLHGIQLDWFGQIFGRAEASADQSPVRIFVMGDDRWRDEDDWPIRRTRHLDVHLRSDGRANRADGDGRLTLAPPGDEPSDQFTYDPESPVPTRGGAVLGVPAGVYDQRDIEARDDVLVYTSAPLAAAVEVTGAVRVVLHAASSAVDTDFTAKLVDVRPDGYARNVVDGIARARLRDSLADPSLLEPDRPFELEIDLWSTSHVFAAGHRMRLDVSSSNFPRWDRNPNTGDPFGHATRTVVARQQVFHDRWRPSRVVLPVIEDRGDPVRALRG